MASVFFSVFKKPKGKQRERGGGGTRWQPPGVFERKIDPRLDGMDDQTSWACHIAGALATRQHWE